MLCQSTPLLKSLIVQGDPDHHSAVEALCRDTFTEREREGEGHASREHLAVEALSVDIAISKH